MNVLSLIANLMLHKVTRWEDDSEVTFGAEEREQAPDIRDANVSTSLRMDVEGMHAVLLDIDVPAALIPSSTPGHSHLYVDVCVPQDTYFRMLDAIADAGVIQRGFVNASKSRGGTSLRLPWVRKSDANQGPAISTTITEGTPF